MESINESSKLVAQAIDSLKYELSDCLPDTFDHQRNISEVITILQNALEKLTNNR